MKDSKIPPAQLRPYTDGFGRWHVTVPCVGTHKAQRERARRAIAREVKARQGDQKPTIRLAFDRVMEHRDGYPIRTWYER